MLVRHQLLCTGGVTDVNRVAAAFHSVGVSTTLALIPIENSLHGAVIETLDLLRSPDVGKTVHIREQFAFTINHSLIVRQGTSISDVKTVLSHEQVGGSEAPDCVRDVDG